MISNKEYSHNHDVHNTSFKGPLFIFGNARSGTTYLRRLLNSFSNIFLQYESTTIHKAYDIFQREDILKDRAIFQSFLDRLDARELRNTAGKPSVLFTQPVKFYDKLYESFCNHRDFSEFCQELFSVSVKPGDIWGNKLVDRDELKMLIKVFINAKFIIIFRDIRSVACSNHEFFGGNYLTTAMIWADTSRIIQSVLDSNSDQRVMTIRYEDLVLDSKLNMVRIASFIGIELPSDFSVAENAHTKSIEKWRSHLSFRQVREIEELCFNEMNDFGYKPEQAEGPKKMNQFSFILSLFLHIKGRLIKRRGGLKGMFNVKSLSRYIKLHKKVSSIKKS